MAMYNVGDRVVVTAWELDLQQTQVLHGTVVEIGKENEVAVEMDDGERRTFRFDEVQKL